ncbi:uncharacterized protein LOC135842799 [Planococcus citri]|uniref:uncharacterized protein LOC135842799 n=1 Tax=Planococcus citri TaxID=170843 RepID=UPI0031F9FF7A
MQSAFKRRICSFRIRPTADFIEGIREFMNAVTSYVSKICSEISQTHENFKYNLELFAKYVKHPDIEDIKSFNTKNVIFNSSTSNFCEQYSDFQNVIDSKSEEFQGKGSGWMLKNVQFLEINFNKFNPLNASSFMPLPQWLEKRKAVLNIRNVDNACFAWCIVAALSNLQQIPQPNRQTSYTHYSTFPGVNFQGLTFPMKLTDIPKFEALNPEISVNVYGVENESVCGPLYYRQVEKSHHINLLYLKNDSGNSHYCLIRSMSRLISRQINQEGHEKKFCDGCLLWFYDWRKLEEHKKNDCNHVRTFMPFGERSFIKFKNISKMLRVPFVIYTDFEAFLKPFSSCFNDLSKSFTEKISIHQPFSFGYYIKCSFDPSLDKFNLYRGSDCVKKFWEEIQKEVEWIRPHMLTSKPMNSLTPEQKESFENASCCYICNMSFSINDVKVHDHDHYTGCYRGPAHSVCNQQLKRPCFIPIVIHNLSNYDAHFLIPEIGYNDEKVDLIPCTKEKYISFSKSVQAYDHNDDEDDEIGAGTTYVKNLKIRFIDSCRFMACSLDKLAKNLQSDQLETLRTCFPNEPYKFELLKEKGVFPYEFVDCEDKLALDSLPSHDQFYSKLVGSNISEMQYKQAAKVWQEFKCKNLGEYSDLYLKTDVLLLTDVFENFRNICLKTYGLDPAQYYTAPGLSWDAMLKQTKISLQLFSDVDMFYFIKQGIRGGLSQCSKRMASANNKYMSNYDPSQPSSYLVYLDANNLYGWAMSQPLPTNNFRWLKSYEVEYFNLSTKSDDSCVGYILEVDLIYPENLHNSHKGYPFCPENIIPPNKTSKHPKLIANVQNKSKYVIHYRNLKQCLKHGLKLVKIHRILEFNQSPWLKTYIDLNTSMRAQASNEFEKDFYKLMNNAVFGKTMENVDKRVDVRLLTHWENRGRKWGAQHYISFPNFHSSSIFNENLVAVQMNKVKVVYDKPIYIGFCVLDLAKYLMYDFHYEYIIPKYDTRVELLYTDTDSLIYEITTNDFYTDIKDDIDARFDTSEYPINNRYGLPQVNKKVVGMFKDECKGKLVLLFLGTKAKSYCYGVEDELKIQKIVKKIKGVKKNVVENDVTLDDFKNCLENKVTIYKQMYNFRSFKHVIFTQLLNKIALTYDDDKRFIIPNSEDTLPWGHCDISKYLLQENNDS